jgi:hypothetical protein
MTGGRNWNSICNSAFRSSQKNEQNKKTTPMKITHEVLLQTKRYVLGALLGASIVGGALVVQGGEIIPYKSQVAGQMTLKPDGGYKIEETGIGAHFGKFRLVGETDAQGILWFTLSAANGDEVFGFLVDAAPDLSWVKLVIYDGTGRFEGSTGIINANVAMNWLTLNYTGVGSGSISTVGSTKKP